MRTIQPSDVLTLDKDKGELVFRFTIADRVTEQEAVSYEGVGYIVQQVGALAGAQPSGHLGARAKVVDLTDLGATPFALRLEKGDVVVLKTSIHLTEEQTKELRLQALEAFPGYPSIVLGPGLEIGKVST